MAEGSERINLLYLTPLRIFSKNQALLLQWESIRTLIPCFLESLYDGKTKVLLHEFDKIFTGLRNASNLANAQNDIIAKTSTLWYYLTRTTHQSIGPRAGNFAERLIGYWVDMVGRYKIDNRINIKLRTVLEDIFDIRTKYKNRIDFVAISSNQKEVAFIELRMSEHTGGRTAQSSLTDKHKILLDLINEGVILERIKKKEINILRLIIAILFNENHELIKRDNYEKGRINSLISYIMNDDNIWGRINKLKANGFTFCNGKPIIKNEFSKQLHDTRKVCIKRGNLVITIEILLGDEFFTSLTGLTMEQLISKFIDTVADDIWVMFTLTLNELKIAQLFGETNVRRLYDLCKNNSNLCSTLTDFEELYRAVSRESHTEIQLEEYLDRLNKIINDLRTELSQLVISKGISLRLLETNDYTWNYIYLKYVAAAIFMLYLTLDIEESGFKSCKWTSK